ncbi:MAG: VOC family protein [Planctomycetia bacterium]|nr:VOC family protein [Planctomycetia bacterium]
MPTVQGNKIVPCLWFDDQGEAAAKLYVETFPNSKITAMTHYCGAGQEIHGRPTGSVMTVSFELDGQAFTALNGGPMFKFTEAVSLQVMCDTQTEIDRYWDQLTAGGDENAQQCGWLKDRFGLSWQITPKILPKMITSGEAEKAQRALQAMLGMKKLDIAALQKAYDG